MEILALSTTMTGILYAVAIVGGVGLIIGIALGIAGKFLSVEVDEKEVAIREALPVTIAVVVDMPDVMP